MSNNNRTKSSMDLKDTALFKDNIGPGILSKSA
jgi:hypothetical protein